MSLMVRLVVRDIPTGIVPNPMDINDTRVT